MPTVGASFVGLLGGNFSKTWRLQRNYLFEVILPDLGGANGADISKYCQKVSFGDYNMSDLATMRYGAYRAKYAGALEVANVSMTFLKPVPDNVTSYFYEWRKLIVSQDGFYFVKSSYAKVINVILYDTTGQQNGRFRLLGAFPRTFPAYDLGYEKEDITQFTIEFSVDRIELE